MRWRKGRRSQNVEDRRGRPAVRRSAIGGGGALVVIVLALLFGQDPMQLLGLLNPEPTQPTQRVDRVNDEDADFVAAVLADTEDTWAGLFQRLGQRYQPPTLVLYSDMVESACGLGSAAAGPFYCPPDRKLYIDLSFFRELPRLGAPGDFARAYVVAHEVGHHVQNLLGTSDRVRQLQQRAGKADANALSVMTELQADCYAGVWAHHAERQRQILESGDIEEGLGAAAAVGDDRLQKMAGRRVQPESFTHGSSSQRVEWFRVGLDRGALSECDTFARR